MENKILDLINYYYSDDDEDPILFNYSAYSLYTKLETLFVELRKEIKNNLESENDDKMEYLNSFDTRIFKYYSDHKYRSSKYFYSLNKLIGEISIEPRLLPILKSELSCTSNSFDDNLYYHEQLVFFEFVKNHHLLNLSPFVKKYKKQLSKAKKINVKESFIHKPSQLSQSNLDFYNPSFEQEINPIFKNIQGFALFNYLLNELNINIITVEEEPNQTLLNAIWRCSPEFKKMIFKSHTNMKKYVEYLNKTFNTEYSNRSMSRGDSYVKDIEDYIRNYKMN
jgi:hypothetical protein